MPIPQKQVRFAYEVIVHSPRAPSPALPFVPSITSSAVLTTPPSRSTGLLSYVRSSPGKASPYVGSILPHTLLQSSAVIWDIMEKPFTITRNSHSLSKRQLYEPATTPPLPFLSIDSTHLPWIIKVYASNGSFVTLGDVFDSIHHSLRANITKAEFNSFPNQKNQNRAARAYQQRYKRLQSTSARDEEKRGGMKRIDFLMCHTKFQGISHTGPRPDKWQLNITR